MKEENKDASFSFKVEAKTAAAELNGDYAKIDLISSGNRPF